MSPTGRPTVSHTTVNAAGQADRLAHHKALLQEGLGMLDRESTIPPQPSSISRCLFGAGLLRGGRRGPAGTDGKPGLGRRGQGTAWLAQGAVGWLHVCTIFKGPTRSLLQLITEVQVNNSMRVNSISAEKQKSRSQLVINKLHNSTCALELKLVNQPHVQKHYKQLETISEHTVKPKTSP